MSLIQYTGRDKIVLLLTFLTSVCGFLSTGINVISIRSQKASYLISNAELSQDNENKKLFIFGLGYTGVAIARAAKRLGYSVAGTCTTLEKCEAINYILGINSYPFNDASPLTTAGLEELCSSSHVLTTVPPSVSLGDPVLNSHISALKFSKCLRWFGYLSSTSVYGDANGGWVDENSDPCPLVPKAIARLDAEIGWRAQRFDNASIHVFRLGAIYGPGRNAIETLIKHNGNLSECGGDDNTTSISRIHVDDIVQSITAMFQDFSPQLLNLVDSRPATRHDVYSLAAELLNYPIKRFVNETMLVKTRSGGNKKVDGSNLRKMLENKDMELLYEDYVCGLNAIASMRAFKLSNLEQD